MKTSHRWILLASPALELFHGPGVSGPTSRNKPPLVRFLQTILTERTKGKTAWQEYKNFVRSWRSDNFCITPPASFAKKSTRLLSKTAVGKGINQQSHWTWMLRGEEIVSWRIFLIDKIVMYASVSFFDVYIWSTFCKRIPSFIKPWFYRNCVH